MGILGWVTGLVQLLQHLLICTVNPITVTYHLICTDALVLTQLSNAVVCVNVCVCVYMFTMHVR